MITDQEALQEAARLMQRAEQICSETEVLEAKLLLQLNELMHAVAKLEIERNAWKFLAQELDKERAAWRECAIRLGYQEPCQ
jgi:hypothetical protein